MSIQRADAHAPQTAADTASETGAAVRAMIVDDSTVVRTQLRRWMTEAGIEVVSSARTGRQAVDDVKRVAPDVILLDIEMPDMTGLEALPLLLEAKPGISIIMVSSLTRRNAEISIRCLSKGAADCIPKPNMTQGPDALSDFKRDLIDKVKVLGTRRAPKRGAPEFGRTALRQLLTPSVSPALRPFSRTRPKVLAIGSSTGGPQALAEVFRSMKHRPLNVPVFITQHMPPNFTAVLAEHLNAASGFPAQEGANGVHARPGHIYVAPGGHHMLVTGTAAEPVIRITDEPPVNYCRPAVDPLFASLSAIYGPAVLGVVLTGMGQDGARGALDIAQGGGSIIAQDEATSVVWGMPGHTVKLGACAAVLPLSEIAPKILSTLAGSAS
ncbi:chemotaxis response regulator protein-glutamate methylesterase of group 2 operon [Agaricicola taiwanensis]|uniref:Protein-glutamate methylesterase/protein-glutamine glutaminase n=1 Tax=Agaricicola taiwanensis TaxID=591372 RepID=A0A8J2YGJ6_9RHOB|nr:chemotaxis response regulator protein-glutamate methylesterase [Agaricicola taiwanensis]GGE39540.1 chemotaxis response regulator protein-glutamate methylesterase of group 2 operon [Agaricicola taiwanensis]